VRKKQRCGVGWFTISRKEVLHRSRLAKESTFVTSYTRMQAWSGNTYPFVISHEVLTSEWVRERGREQRIAYLGSPPKAGTDEGRESLLPRRVPLADEKRL
jgi:hypothetical protein